MQIPTCENAIVPMRKLTEYALKRDHDDGGHKAYLFEKLFGLTVEDADFLRDVLLDNVCNDTAFVSKENDFGIYYVVDFTLNHNQTQAVIRSVWIIRKEEDFPSLTSCYILPRKQAEDD